MKAALDASRKAAAVHERTFLQETPQGDLVIVTLETPDAGDPMAAFGKMMADPTMGECSGWAADVHGIDPKSPPPAARGSSTTARPEPKTLLLRGFCAELAAAFGE